MIRIVIKLLRQNLTTYLTTYNNYNIRRLIDPFPDSCFLTLDIP